MSSATHFPDADDFQRQSDDFISWLSQQPGVRINPHIQVADLRSQGAGRGVVARSDIDDGEELFAIPREVILTVENSNLKNQISQDLDELGPWLSMILVMIHEYLLGEKSAWADYFRVLPSKFDTLMFWTDSELSELQASAIVDKIGKRDADQSILDMVVPIVRANPLLFPPIESLSSYDGEEGARVLLQLAHRMGSLIMAYAFDIEKAEDEEEEEGDEDGYMTDEEERLPKGMVPLADILNADADRNNARLFQEEKFLVMRTIRPVKAGDELFNDYGEIPRADLLRRYGYVTDNYAQYDVVELPLTLICQAAGLNDAEPENQPQLKLLDDLEILEDGYCIPRPSPEDSLADVLPDELLALLKTLALTPEQLVQQKSKNKPPKPAFALPEAQLLLAAVQKRAAQYPTSIEQDKELLSHLQNLELSSPLEGSPRRQKMAIQVRLGEKEIICQLFTMITGYIESAKTNSEGSSSAKRNAQGDTDGSRKAKVQKT